MAAEEAVSMAKQLADGPFPVELVSGEPSPTQVNYKFLNTTDSVKAALAKLSQVYEAEIQTQRRGSVSWDQTQLEAGKYIADLMGSTNPAAPRVP